MARTVVGTLDVQGLKQATPEHVYQQWLAYYQIEPWGDDWDQTAVISASAMNPHLKKPKRLEEFKPSYKPTRKQTPEQIEANLALCFSMMGR